jgi:hypothetical protein
MMKVRVRVIGGIGLLIEVRDRVKVGVRGRVSV